MNSWHFSQLDFNLGQEVQLRFVFFGFVFSREREQKSIINEANDYKEHYFLRNVVEGLWILCWFGACCSGGC